jgi:hypothetical protein
MTTRRRRPVSRTAAAAAADQWLEAVLRHGQHGTWQKPGGAALVAGQQPAAPACDDDQPTLPVATTSTRHSGRSGRSHDADM